MDRINIETKFNGVDSVSFRIKPKLKNKTNLVAFILGMPLLMKRITGSYENGARYLVDNDLIPKEEMRKILEISIRESINQLNTYLDMVKVGGGDDDNIS